ncbi:MAG: tRNA uridine-5-carboxymethylaminomethyl(34) synthesis GTPase MnmE [Endomicrobium sp.]|jgi:tRNA modification GTPase|nr:tRNA uridine-5-carboxymethylaminomethyl(34) synthesis GTPase MnmE [Endomicrobium sp.]
MNYTQEDTIAALSTPFGRSAIAIIRVSGKKVFDVMNQIFQTSSLNKKKQIQYGYIVYQNQIKDEVLCSFFYAPKTYTGENLVEISVHGNPIIIESVLNVLYMYGVRPANPGEFTYRAFLNGKIDLLKAEAICSLISSKTKISAQLSLNNINKVFSKQIKHLLKIIINLRTFLEASLDYPEEEIPILSQTTKLDKINDCIKIIKKLLYCYNSKSLIDQYYNIIIIGKPNVGKSSIFNSIIQQNRAIVTNIAGTTTDILEKTIEYKGISLNIIDTAGITEYSNNSIEILGQQKTKEGLSIAHLIIWVFDVSSNLDENDHKILHLLRNNTKHTTPTIALLNKNDLHSILSINTIEKFYNNVQKTINVSVKQGINITMLLNLIIKTLGVSLNKVKNVDVMINLRHKKLLDKIFNDLLKIKQDLCNDEIICFHLQSIHDNINEILGTNIKQDILKNIFSQFCIGK